jgi:hypothetical protein
MRGSKLWRLRPLKRACKRVLEQGRTTVERGLQQGQRLTLEKQLEVRFGRLSSGARERLEKLSPEQLETLTVALLKAQSFHELGMDS